MYMDVIGTYCTNTISALYTKIDASPQIKRLSGLSTPYLKQLSSVAERYPIPLLTAAVGFTSMGMSAPSLLGLSVTPISLNRLKQGIDISLMGITLGIFNAILRRALGDAPTIQPRALPPLYQPEAEQDASPDEAGDSDALVAGAHSHPLATRREQGSGSPPWPGEGPQADMPLAPGAERFLSVEFSPARSTRSIGSDISWAFGTQLTGADFPEPRREVPGDLGHRMLQELYLACRDHPLETLITTLACAGIGFVSTAPVVALLFPALPSSVLATLAETAIVQSVVAIVFTIISATTSPKGF
jgi:hypothetical protein